MRTSTLLLAAALVATPAVSADSSVSVIYGEPGFYGRLDIGDAPPPVLIYPEPILIIHSHTVGPPIYMRVPPGHAKHWKDHCAAYGACGHRVYFVQDGWYQTVYVPHYREHHGKAQGHGKKKGRPHGKGKN